MSDLDVIKKIEKLIGEPLKPCPADSNIMDWDQQNTFLLNSQQQVTGLNIRSKQINDISVLKALPKLTDLDLSQNQISDISVLKALPNLTDLYLSNNKISDISVLKALPNLTQLDLSNNPISDISVLKALPNLTQLGLIGNQISDISVLEALPNLTQLSLSYNQISDISVLEALPNLTQLSLSYNQISDISVLKALPNLTRLDLNRNRISELPEWLLNLNIPIHLDIPFHIKWNPGDGIFLESNPIEKPPLEIIKQGNEAIRAYFEQLRKEGFDTIYEAKLILVGEGGAGKTSLANKIINPHWQLIPEIKSESTKGIDILSYQFPIKDKTFRVNIWDFGGQEIYHQTHQFFLSKRALYFLLTDDRKEDTDFYHWLNIVDLLSANSPVVIIKNEKSKRSRDIPEQELKEFNNIKAILATDLSDNRGLDKIIKDLQHYITELPHIGAPLPKTWVKVREQLEQDDRYYIDLKDYFALCQANGFENEADKLQLSEYLHDLGVCLHFQNHPLLRKTLILKPTWATDAVYKVLDNDTVKNQAGHFNDKDLADIWQDEQYNTMRGELLALMQKFKLCYEIRNQPHQYIAPQLLKDKAPQYDWPTNDLLLLRYKYDFMPKGILSQFIVEMHEHIAHDYQWVWKSGVILEKDNAQAEIIEYYGKREIQIRVHGNNKKELLNIVSYELDKINSSYERLRDKCNKLIPCNCETCSGSEEPYFLTMKN
ncbi:MAG: leucine-rich repeat domain-containing protein [Methylococcales bacterium]|nr:leucine-rich repeat domain-containing protein [Methylococcales bacterium]